MFKKYTIAGVNNPNWQLVEPALLKTWAYGIFKASYLHLYFIHIASLLIALVTFFGGFVLRILLVGSILFLGYAIFEESLALSISTVLPSFWNDTSMMSNISDSNLWIYQVLGYVILIKSVIFVFGNNFTEWVKDSVFYIFFMITGMIPLKWIARGIIKENYLMQLFAKKRFMGMHISQTISAAPPEFKQQYDKLIDLYQRSNDESARKQLEEMCAKN